MNRLIEKFNKIRDIEYRIPLKENDPDFCCSGKAKMLKDWLDENGYISRYRVVNFKWSNIYLPKELFAINHDDNCTHVYLELFIDNKWIDIDPTWDRELKEFFPVNFWDGESDCKIAVSIDEKISIAESEKTMSAPFDEKDIGRNGDFYIALNEHLDNIRRHSNSK